MKQKIGFVIHNMTGGGAERFVAQLLTGLADEFEIHLILFEDIVEYELPKGQIVTFIEEGFASRRNLANIARIPLASMRLKRYCEANGLQLLVSFLNRPNFTSCFAKFLGLKIPVLISERTFTPAWFPENELRGRIAKRLVSWLYPKADAIMPNSNGTRNALEQHYGVRSKYFVIRNIVDLESIEIAKHESVDDIEFKKFTFLHLGSFSHMKGHGMLAHAFNALARSDAQLIFMGKGGAVSDIKALVQTLEHGENIKFPGHRSNVFKYLHRADCFVLASEFEGFPNVLIEAMACALPIISTDCQTGPRELLAPATDYRTRGLDRCEHGEYGLLVPVGDRAAMTEAMAEMMQNTGMRNHYKARCAGKAAEYDSRIVMEEFRQIITSYLPAIE